MLGEEKAGLEPGDLAEGRVPGEERLRWGPRASCPRTGRMNKTALLSMSTWAKVSP